MSERIHVLAQHLFGKSSIDECDLDEIRSLANRYPYFAPAQFLLLEKLKTENSPEYGTQLQKAVLYYPDPLEFEYFISSGRFYTEIDLDEIKDSPAAEEIPVENTKEETVEAAVLPEVEIVPEIKAEESSVETQMNESIERVLVQEEKQAEAAPQENDDLVFEPYHTVDYFASQGIKLSQEEVPKDKFGKQLKSFTEWLKTMKRISRSDISKTVDPSTESTVQHMAEDSVHDSSVVTETMAEVWAKQGNKEKALKIYEQLSLLNPSKKAYFADLIENLKRS